MTPLSVYKESTVTMQRYAYANAGCLLNKLAVVTF